MTEEEKIELYENTLKLIAGFNHMAGAKWRKQFPELHEKISYAAEGHGCAMSDHCMDVLEITGVKL